MLQSHSCRLTHAPHRSSANCHCSVLLWTTILRENAWNQKWHAVQTYKDTSPVLVAQVAVEPHDPVDLALVPFRWVLIALGKGHRGRDRNVDATQLCNAQRWPQIIKQTFGRDLVPGSRSAGSGSCPGGRRAGSGSGRRCWCSVGCQTACGTGRCTAGRRLGQTWRPG